MVPAPFTAADVRAVLSPLAAILIAVGGLSMMIIGPRRYTTRALALGIAIAFMSGCAAMVFE